MIGKLLKQAAEACAKEAVDCQLLSGTVKTAAPLTVEVDERFLLTEEHLLLPAHLKALTLSVGGEHSGSAKLQSDLAAGEKLILLAVSGRYLILGKEEQNGTVQLTLA